MRIAKKMIGVCTTIAFVTQMSIGPVHAESPIQEPPAAPEQVWAETVQTIADRDGISVETAAALLAALLTPSYVHPSPAVQQWYSTALEAGWAPGQWRWLSCVIRRESNGQPGAYNRRGHALGLTQIVPVNIGFLRRQGIIDNFYDLGDPLTNLRAAKALFDYSGKSPWRYPRHPC